MLKLKQIQLMKMESAKGYKMRAVKVFYNWLCNNAQLWLYWKTLNRMF